MALRVRVVPFQPGITGAPKPSTVYMAELYDDEDPPERQKWACGHEQWKRSEAQSCGEAELTSRG